jgi:predicted nuclease of restriction endonuclease-like (RecB) superfamily
MPIRDALKRNFYAEMSKIMKWNPKELQAQISEELFERTSTHCDISNKQASVTLDALKGGMTEELSDFIYDSTDPLEF